MNSRAKTAILIVATASLLAACGVRGSLEKPSASATEGAPPAGTADADSGQGKKIGDAPKPHKPFILDGLLQ